MKTEIRNVLTTVSMLAFLCGSAVGQTQTVPLPGNGAPLLVTPEIHLGSPRIMVGATNATAGNTAGAANMTATLPTIASDITAIPSFAAGASTATFTPVIGPMSGTAPSTPVAHLSAAEISVGASNATAGSTAGAASATSTLPVMPRGTRTVPQYVVGGNTVTVVVASAQTGTEAAAPEVGVAEIGGGGPREAGSGIVDRGIAAANAPGARIGDKSLGEIARAYRARKATASPGSQNPPR